MATEFYGRALPIAPWTLKAGFRMWPNGDSRRYRTAWVRIPTGSIDNLQNRLVTGSSCRRVQKIAHCGDRLPIAPDDFPHIRSPHFYLEQDLGALFNLRYQHFVWCFHQVLDHELQEVFHKTNQAWAAAASFLRALRIILATVSLGRAPFFTQYSARSKLIS